MQKGNYLFEFNVEHCNLIGNISKPLLVSMIFSLFPYFNPKYKPRNKIKAIIKEISPKQYFLSENKQYNVDTLIESYANKSSCFKFMEYYIFYL